jgi:D-alanyl-lipoteichoic acid acyltransferase DltB (MBOAT superfamily)
MVFNSIDFAIFLPIVFFLYWFVVGKDIRFQNFLLVIASYLFYAWWDWRFLSLILISTFVDYSVGVYLSNEKNILKRKFLLWLSIFVNIGILGVFKYYDFFLNNYILTFSFFGVHLNANSLNIILPIGISFYTFQTLSYTIDIYRGKLKPTKDFIAFSAFVSFFPQLVAGPIERATNLLPQFLQKRKFDYSKAVDGLRQILWGLFKKVVIADNLAKIVNEIFKNSADYSGSTLVLGAVFFAFQIYGDFSGYSDIAIGTSRLFGFDLKQNFAFPYFSRDIAEFWRRWHISLSTWFRDYLYIPLGGSRVGILKQIRNIFIVFIISGLWHGANWTFIIWGALNAIYYLPLLLQRKNRVNMDVIAKGKLLPTWKEMFYVIGTFILTVFAWIFFRAETISHAFEYISGIFNESFFTIPTIISIKLIILLIFLVGFIIIEWLNRDKKHALFFKDNIPNYIRYSFYFGILLSILWFHGDSQDFIYFQF